MNQFQTFSCSPAEVWSRLPWQACATDLGAAQHHSGKGLCHGLFLGDFTEGHGDFKTGEMGVNGGCW